LSAIVTAEQGTSSTSYTNLSTTGPSITLPLAGDYDVALGARGYNNTAGHAGYMSFAIGASTAADSDGFDLYTLTTSAGYIPNHSTVRRKTGLSAVALTAKYKVSTSGTAYFQNRYLIVTPIRVG
jgi:hypothetical protein